jgi:uncharacterized protein
VRAGDHTVLALIRSAQRARRTRGDCHGALPNGYIAPAGDMLPALAIAHSRIHGRGVFAQDVLPAAVHAFAVHGKRTRGRYDHRAWIGPHWYSAGWNEWIVPAAGTPARYVNHSCKPSCRLSDQFTVTPLRRLRPGDELTIDYATTELDPRWAMACRCNARGCRRSIRPFYLETEQVRSRLLSLVPARLRLLGACVLGLSP